MRSVRITMLICVITMGVTHRTHIHMTRMLRHTTPTTTITMEAIHRHTKLLPVILTVLLLGQVIGPLPQDTCRLRSPLVMHHHPAKAILRHRATVLHLQVTCLLATHRPIMHHPHIHRHQVVATRHQLNTLVTLRIRHPILATNSLPLATVIPLINAASLRATPWVHQTMGATVLGETASVGARHLLAWMEADEAVDFGRKAREGNTATSECLGNCRLQNFAAAGCHLLWLLLSLGRSST
mmetsp:Transcript_44139/g.84751  ORF Transcript_44139/g.84751 Transcript_44139/m.84751 type:complete len:240 (+) Transcript_44139:494-1213(+)